MYLRPTLDDWPPPRPWSTSVQWGNFGMCKTCMYAPSHCRCPEHRLSTILILWLDIPYSVQPFRFRIHPGEASWTNGRLSDYGEDLQQIQTPANHTCGPEAPHANSK